MWSQSECVKYQDKGDVGSRSKLYETLYIYTAPDPGDPQTVATLFTCVFVFMPEQGAALLEDLVTQVTGVHPALQPTHLLQRRGRV